MKKKNIFDRAIHLSGEEITSFLDNNLNWNRIRKVKRELIKQEGRDQWMEVYYELYRKDRHMMYYPYIKHLPSRVFNTVVDRFDEAFYNLIK